MTSAAPSHPEPGSAIRLGLILFFALACLAYVVFSWHWPLMWDMQVIHYVTFLMDHGWAPYRQIGDMNMPGSYMFEHWALLIFGHTDLGWRWWDFTLCAALAGSMFAIARKYDSLAAVLGAGSFILTHAAEGPKTAGQRDQVLAVLLLVATALLFESVRRKLPWLFYPFGLAAAMAAAIKPTVILLGPVLLLMAVWEMRRRGERWQSSFWWGVAGLATALVLVLHFLLSWHVMRAFFDLLHDVIPHYAGTVEITWPELIRLSLPIPLFVYTACAIVAWFLNRAARPRSWEMPALLLGVAMGALSFFGQHKGFAQHRYPMLAFLLLWDSVQIVMVFRASDAWLRRIAAFATLVVVLFGGRMLVQCRAQPRVDRFSKYLEADLRRMGIPALQHEVQCLDIVDGCMTALFHLGIVQNTGYTGDLLLFLPHIAPPVELARSRYWQLITANPPDVYVVSNWQFSVRRHTFTKLDTWPAFRQYLDDHYILLEQKGFPEGGDVTSGRGEDPDVQAYRIYARRGSPPLANWQGRGTSLSFLQAP